MLRIKEVLPPSIVTSRTLVGARDTHGLGCCVLLSLGKRWQFSLCTVLCRWQHLQAEVFVTVYVQAAVDLLRVCIGLGLQGGYLPIGSWTSSLLRKEGRIEEPGRQPEGTGVCTKLANRCFLHIESLLSTVG